MAALATVVAPNAEVKIDPRLKKKLQLELKVYAALDADLKAAQHARDKSKDAVEAIRAVIGENSLAVDGFRITRIEGVTSRLDHKKLKAQGITDAQLEAATVTTPRKPFTKVTLPGAKDDE